MNKSASPLGYCDYYPSRAFQIIASFFAANAVILFEEKKSLLYIISNKGFYIASAVSCLMTYLIIKLVIYITLRLDQHYPWYKNYKKRLMHQIALTVILPVLPLFLGASFYFKFHQINVFKTVYIRRYIPLIILLLITLSAYLHYLWEKKQRFKKTPKSLLITKEKSEVLSFEEIAYLYAEEKNCYSVNFYGEKLIWNLSLSESIVKLPENQFFRVRRSHVVNINAIAEIKIIDCKRTIIILTDPIAKFGLNFENSSLNQKEIKTSSRVNASFKSWYVRHSLGR